tara:strand:+ start:335 stop:997 length:663 start_codon:yes stop_codon:yes gene_type:complete
MKKLIIFGTGDIAELAMYYFNNDTNYSVEAFTIDSSYKKSDQFCELAVVDFEKIQKVYDPKEFSMFIALSYTEMNELRARKVNEAKKKGFSIASYVSSNCTTFGTFSCGENCFILEDNTIQPFVEIGNNVTMWSGNHIGHHSKICDNAFISSHAVISGGVEVGRNSFLGVNSTINDHIKLGEYSLIASGALINKNTNDFSVCIGAPFKERDSIRSIDIKL